MPGEEPLFEYWKIPWRKLAESLCRIENGKGCKNRKYAECQQKFGAK
jgi:hypothetical protein